MLPPDPRRRPLSRAAPRGLATVNRAGTWAAFDHCSTKPACKAIKDVYPLQQLTLDYYGMINKFQTLKKTEPDKEGSIKRREHVCTSNSQ